MRFLDVKTDYAFKKVFGSSQSHDILKSFLNAIIRFNDDLKIRSLEIVDPYNIPMIKGMKDSYVDVKARLEDDSLVIIEMQVLNHQGFEKRVLYNAAKNYSVQLTKSDDYHLLNPVIALSIVDFDMFEESDKVVSNFKLIEKDAFIHYSDDIELVFIELPKFSKNLDELDSLKDKWIYFIQNAGKLDFVPENIDKDIKDALGIANEANLSNEELELQRKRKEFIFIQKYSIELAKERGLAEGKEDGRKEGLKEGLIEGIGRGELNVHKKIVINANKSGMTVQEICNITGLSEEAVMEIMTTFT